MLKTIEYLTVKVLYETLRRIPFKISILLAHLFRFFAQYIIRYRRDLVQRNLRVAFAEMSEEEISIMFDEVYKNFSMLWIEFLQSWRLNEEYFAKNFSIHNWDVVEEAVYEGKGIIFISGHLGNYEWLGNYLAVKFNNIYAIQKRLSNKRVDEMVGRLRRRLGVKLIYTKSALKKGLQILQKKNILAIVGDQDAGDRGIFVDFFGKPASTAAGTAIFHLQTGAPIIFTCAIRKAWGKYDVYFERLPEVSAGISKRDAILEVTKAHTLLLEKWVRKFPGQYFWTHRRWKTQPQKNETVVNSIQETCY